MRRRPARRGATGGLGLLLGCAQPGGETTEPAVVEADVDPCPVRARLTREAEGLAARFAQQPDDPAVREAALEMARSLGEHHLEHHFDEVQPRRAAIVELMPILLRVVEATPDCERRREIGRILAAQQEGSAAFAILEEHARECTTAADAASVCLGGSMESDEKARARAMIEQGWSAADPRARL